jgi:hypothetical protein
MPLFGIGTKNITSRLNNLEKRVNYIRVIVNSLANEEKKRRNEKIKKISNEMNARRKMFNK